MAPWFKISNRILSLFLLVTPGLSAPQSQDSVLAGVSGNVKSLAEYSNCRKFGASVEIAPVR